MRDIIKEVEGAFCASGTTLKEHCRGQSIPESSYRYALKVGARGKKSTELRKHLIDASLEKLKECSRVLKSERKALS